MRIGSLSLQSQILGVCGFRRREDKAKICGLMLKRYTFTQSISTSKHPFSLSLENQSRVKMADDKFPELSAEQLDKVRNTIYPSLPTYRADDGGSIATSDIPGLFDGLGLPRSDDVMKKYGEYWELHHEGRIPLEAALHVLGAAHVPAKWMVELISLCDKNQDGFIDKDEFKQLIEMSQLHCPGWTKSYEEFLAEADVNKEGKVSNEEALAWHAKNAPV